MTLNEFKAWLDGFSASIDGSPTKEQWEAIKKKLDSVYPVQNQVINITPASSAQIQPIPVPNIIPLSLPWYNPNTIIC